MATCAIPVQFGSRLTQAERMLNLVDGCRYSFGQIAHRWNDCVASERKTVSENYLEGRISVILNFAVSHSAERMGSDQIVTDLPSGNANFFSLIIDKNDPIDEFELRFGDQKPMFIFNVEIIEGTNELPIAARVRLYGFHDAVDDIFRGTLCKSTIQAVFKGVPGLIHGKSGVVASATCSSEFDLCDNVVKRGSEIVQGITKRKGEGVRQSLSRSDLKEIISSIRIVLHDDFMGLSIRELSQYHVEVIDMLYGPLDF